jgi:hypothetical protein
VQKATGKPSKFGSTILNHQLTQIYSVVMVSLLPSFSVIIILQIGPLHCAKLQNNHYPPEK